MPFKNEQKPELSYFEKLKQFLEMPFTIYIYDQVIHYNVQLEGFLNIHLYQPNRFLLLVCLLFVFDFIQLHNGMRLLSNSNNSERN